MKMSIDIDNFFGNITVLTHTVACFVSEIELAFESPKNEYLCFR